MVAHCVGTQVPCRLPEVSCVEYTKAGGGGLGLAINFSASTQVLFSLAMASSRSSKAPCLMFLVLMLTTEPQRILALSPDWAL